MWFKLNTTFTTSLGKLSELTNSWPITRYLTNFTTASNVLNVEKNGAYEAVFTIGTNCTVDATPTVTMSGIAVSASQAVWNASTGTLTVKISSVTGPVVITASATRNSSSGGSEGGEPETPVNPPSGDSFVLTSSMLKNQTYSTSLAAWNSSTKHLATDFIELDPGYDIVFDLPDDWEGYVAHPCKGKGAAGEYTLSKTSLLSGWVSKGIVSTGPSLDKYFIVLQKKNKTTITPSDYDSITGSVQIKKPDARTVTIDSSLLNVGKGYSELNLITMANRLSTWYYALTPGSTVTGTVAAGLKAYIVSVRDGETQFNIDTEWVSSFNKTYDTACSILIVAKKDDGSNFTDASAWTSPITIDIK